MTIRLDRAFAALALIALSTPALAQQPTQKQINAIRSNCRSDFLSNCSGVPRGGPEAVRCLKDHLAQLSPGCSAAVSAITPADAPAPTPAPASAPPAAAPAAPPAPEPAATAAPASAPAAPAPATARKRPPSPPKTAQPDRAAAATAPAAPPPAAQSLLPLPPLPPRVRLMIVRICAAEHRVLCANVPPGGGGIVDCLAEHGEALSPRCRNAILSVK